MKNIDFEEDDSPKIYTEKIEKKKPIAYVFSRLILIGICFILGGVLSVGYIFIKDVLIHKYAVDSISADVAKASLTRDVATQNDIVKYAINNASPSVVSITTLTDTTFFNIPTKSASVGSGIIFHKSATDTFIATNYHVVENASKVGVAIGDNEPILSELVGKDANSDLAVIAIKNEELAKLGIKDVRVAKFSNDTEIQVGDYVVAIGNAVGEGITSTFGIVSSTSKDIVTSERHSLEGVIQTTAAINPGNSGGALINLKGEVVGINTAKEANNLVEGMGYTISSKVAMPIIEQIMNNTRPASLGIEVVDTSSVTDDINIPGGALVVTVFDGSSAKKYGIRAGDIITSINNTPILSTKTLLDEMKKYSVSDILELKVIRDGKVETLNVKLLQNINKPTSF